MIMTFALHNLRENDTFAGEGPVSVCVGCVRVCVVWGVGRGVGEVDVRMW